MHPVLAALERQGKLSKDDFDYIVEHGEEFRGIKLPSGIRRYPPGSCLDAADALEAKGRGHYVRGFALLPGSRQPLAHAWVTANGWHAIDAVWPDPELCSYWGLRWRRHEARLSAMPVSMKKAPVFSIFG